MAVRKYRRTLIVTDQVIELWPGIFLPIGHYDVVDEHLVVHRCGRSGEIPGRLVLKLTREELISYGADLSGFSILGIETDIRQHVGKPGIALK